MITVLTPTYNRKKYLERLYNSLKKQSVQHFQWLIIDDGSTDNTETLVQSFTDHCFDLEYHKKKNGGKHTALNFSHNYIRGDYVCIVDSDDYLLPNAIEKIEEKKEEYSKYPNVRVLVFRRGNPEMVPLCDSFPKEDTLSNSIDFIINSKRKGDCCEVIDTNALKEFPFPEYKDERFLSEGYLWNNVAFRYDSVYISDVIYICEYLDGGLSKSGRRLRIQSPKGGMDNCNAFFLSMNKRSVHKGILRKEAMLYVCYGKFAGYSYKQIVDKAINSNMIKKYYFLGELLYHYWKHRYL